MKFGEFNHNVKVALAYTAIGATGAGIWGSTVLSGYLKVLTGTNAKVGLAEGIQGMSQLVFAFPSGVLSDKLGRDRILKLSTIVGFFAIILILAALHSFEADPNTQYIVLSCGLACWGSFIGCSAPALEALYADSTTTENRTTMNQYKFTTTLLAASLGPGLSILMFLLVGDDWSILRLRIVFTVGICILFPGICMFYFFDDKKALVTRENKPSALKEPLLEDSDIEQDDSQSVMSSAEPEMTESRRLAMKYIPPLMTFADCIAGIAAGMTIKFFPLFFKEETGLSPIEVSLVVLSATLLVACFSYFARLTAAKIGPARTLLVFQVPGTLLLMSMYFMGVGYDIKNRGQVPLWRNVYVIIPVYLLRTALMNAVSPIRKAILMDHVLPKDRGFWNAFDSMFRFGWSGSAFLGGILMDSYGYGVTFFATSLLQLFYVLGIGLVLLKFID